MAEQHALVAVAIGNSRLRYAFFQGAQLHESHAAGIASMAETARELANLATPSEDGTRTPVVISSVNESAAAGLETALAHESPELALYRIGRDVPIDMMHTLDDASTTGHDRLLCALGAFEQARQACIVIDAGTAVTVDFIDGEGVFHGGAIAPGARMMLQAMHEHTSALPQVQFAPFGGDTPFGKDTPRAMLRGVFAAIRGMAHHLIEEYAQFYDAYPRIVATGGDAAALFEHDELIEHIVPDLQLIGIRAACDRALRAGHE